VGSVVTEAAYSVMTTIRRFCGWNGSARFTKPI